MVVAVLQGSVRSERMGDRVAKWVVSQLESRGHEAVLVDAAALELPLLDKMWKELKVQSDASSSALREKLKPIAELYERADGFAIVTGEYNHSVPPGLTNLLDFFLEEYFYRPSAIICYSVGGFGGVRAAMQLRALLPEVGMSSIPSIQAIPKVGEALSEDGVELSHHLSTGAGRFFSEFDWYMTALRAGRDLRDPRIKRT